jgi:hypothetical protein
MLPYCFITVEGLSMTSHGHAKREPIVDLLTTLHSKFSTNLSVLDPEVVTLLETIDLNSRAIDGAADELERTHSGGEKHKLECALLIQEIFADFSQAMYLLAIGLVVPARMLMRRGFELGLAIMYMWDLPHEYWGWAKHDQDLSFSKMVDHLCSPGYVELISNLQNKTDPEWPCNSTALQTLYRTLSNTVHGKTDVLQPLSPERYSSSMKNVGEHLKLLVQIQKTILTLWCARFDGVKHHLSKEFPKAMRT